MGTEAYYMPRTPWKAPTFSCQEFEDASLKANPPRVIFDNARDPHKTVIKIDSANRQGCLLEVVQLLTDLDLFISKAIISSDGGWFVDEFYVTDRLGNKVTDRKIIHFVQQALGATAERLVSEVKTCLGKPMLLDTSVPHEGHVSATSMLPRQHRAAVECLAPDRPGLLCDLSRVVSEADCTVTDAEVWTHNGMAACVLLIEEGSRKEGTGGSASMATASAAGAAVAAGGEASGTGGGGGGGLGAIGVSAALSGLGGGIWCTAVTDRHPLGEMQQRVSQKLQEAAARIAEPFQRSAASPGSVTGSATGLAAGSDVSSLAGLVRECGSCAPSGSSTGGSSAPSSVTSPSVTSTSGTCSMQDNREGYCLLSPSLSLSPSPSPSLPKPILRVTHPPRHTGRRLHQLLCAAGGMESSGMCASNGGKCDCNEGDENAWAVQPDGMGRWREEGRVREGGEGGGGGNRGLFTVTEDESGVKERGKERGKGGSKGEANWQLQHDTMQHHQSDCNREASYARDSSVSASVRNCQETHYTVVTVWCRDRPKLFFDTVCVITDLGYLIHHAVVQQEDEGMASQEYFVRTMSAVPLSSSQQHVLSEAIQSAVVRRCPKGSQLQLCDSDRMGLLRDVTQTIAHRQLSIRSASLFTRFGKAMSEFTITHPNGSPVETPLLEEIRREIGPSIVTIAKEPLLQPVRIPSSSSSGSRCDYNGRKDGGQGSACTYNEGEEFSIAKMIRVSSERFLSSLGLVPDGSSTTSSSGSAGGGVRKARAFTGRRW